MKERKLTDYEKSKAEKAFCFYHCKGFRDTKRCFCDSKCKDAQDFIQFLDYVVVKTKEDDSWSTKKRFLILTVRSKYLLSSWKVCGKSEDSKLEMSLPLTAIFRWTWNSSSILYFQEDRKSVGIKRKFSGMNGYSLVPVVMLVVSLIKTIQKSLCVW